MRRVAEALMRRVARTPISAMADAEFYAECWRVIHEPLVEMPRRIEGVHAMRALELVGITEPDDLSLLGEYAAMVSQICENRWWPPDADEGPPIETMQVLRG